MTKVLILASNPRKNLNLDTEIRDLKRVIDSSRQREDFTFVVELAVRVGDLQELMLKHRPQIVHFCGHGGGEQGLVFESDAGREHLVSTEALADLFSLPSINVNVECVLLNACYSEEQAEAIVTHINYVIGMNQKIRDDAAIAFAKGFYRALGFAHDIEEAYKLGCNAIQLEISGSSAQGSSVSKAQRKLEAIMELKNTLISEHLKPILKKKSDFNPNLNPKISQEIRTELHLEIDKSLPKIDNQKTLNSRERKLLLSKVYTSWVRGVLRTSLPTQGIIELQLTELPNEVNSPANENQHKSSQPRTNLPAQTKVIDIFDELGEFGQSLLILGDTGAGKTVVLCELARILIERAEQDISLSMPVVLSLSTWQGGKQSINDWLIQEIKRQYQYSEQTLVSWIDNDQLLLLLDDLNQVSDKLRIDCIQALNQFHQDHGATTIVVSCQTKDYDNCEGKLNFQSAIEIQPLIFDQIKHYLSYLNPELAEKMNRLLKADPQLQKLARSPLILYLMTQTCSETSDEELLNQDSNKTRQRLFDGYIQKRFQRKITEEDYPQEKAKRWLTWLAQQMKKESQIFLIEQMQPSWLSIQYQWIYHVGFRLILGLLCGLSLALLFWRLYAYQPVFEIPTVIPSWMMLIAGLIAGIASGLIIGFLSQIRNGLIFASESKKKLTFGLISGLIFGFTGGLIAWQTYKHNLVYSLLWFLIDSIIFGFMFFLLENRIPDKIEAVNSFAWKWSEAKKNSINGSVGGLTTILFIRILSQGKYSLNYMLSDWLTWIIVFGLIGGGFKNSTQVPDKAVPNQGIRQSTTNAVISIMAFGIITPLLWLRNWDLPADEFSSAMLCLIISFGVIGGLLGAGSSGIVCLQHFFLRIILYLSGDIPWNYSRFLNHATKRGFLHNLGWGYKFRDQLLLEHFADFPNNDS
jgi:hypothetical protein